MQSKNSLLATRHKAVDAYQKLGSFNRAAIEVKKDISFVKRWVQRHEQGQGMRDLPMVGRPSVVVNKEEAIDIIISSMLDRQGPAGMSRRLRAEFGIEATCETITRFVKSNLGRPLRHVKKPE